MNIYFVKDGDGVMLFDAGISQMTNAVRGAGAQLGGITRVAPRPRPRRPPRRRARARRPGPLPRGRAGRRRERRRRALLPPRAPEPDRQAASSRTCSRAGTAAPSTIAETVEEGDEIAGFRVIHLPGHAPGHDRPVARVRPPRARQRLFYTLDPQTGIKGKPRVPHAAFNEDTEQARASILKLAALEPAAAWPGHANPLTRRRALAARDRRGDDVARSWASAADAVSARRAPRRRCRTRRPPTTPAPTAPS